MLLTAGTPVTAANDPPPPPPPTLADCWNQIIITLTDCLHLAWTRPGGFDARIYAACVKGALDGYVWCLDQVVPPHPRPTFWGCWERFKSAIADCAARFPDPCLPNPDPPGGCTPDTAANHGRIACENAARLEWEKCRGFVPRAPSGPRASVNVLPESVLVEPFGKFLNVTISVEPFGVIDWARLNITFVLPDPDAPGSWIEIPGGTLEPTLIDGLGHKPLTLALTIPQAVYDHAQNFMLVLFSLHETAISLDPFDGDVVTMRVMYSQHDLNRDGYIDNADVLIALTRYFAGEMSWAQYQAVLQAVGQ